MIEEMMRVLAVPDFENEEDRRHANLLNIISLSQAVAALSVIILSFLSGSNNLKITAAGGLFLLLAIISQLFIRLKKTGLSSILLITGDWILTTLAIYSLGGLAHPLVNLYFVILIFNVFLIGGRSTIVIAGITALTLFFLSISNPAGELSNIPGILNETWWLESIILVLTAVFLYFGMENLNQALLRSYKKQVLLAKNNQNLATAQISLEKEIIEQTAGIEQRSKYLEASIEVGRAATSILESDELIREVVHLIQKHFDLYYVGLFLVDPGSEWAVLKAGTGEPGEAMQAREHRIKIGNGMVGWSIENAQPRIAAEAKEDAIRLDTPELAATLSKAALPLRSRGKVIGALTIQSSQPHTFDEDMVEVLQNMADQVATAIDNAHLFAESQTALESARKSYDEFNQRAWNKLFKTRSEFGFRYQGAEIFPIEGEWQPELIEAAQTGQRLEISETDKASLTIPIRVRNQVIGALKFRKDGPGKKWTPDEISLLETLTDQLGVALESARLYEETQRRAERERLTSEISAKLRASNDQQMILQTAVQELRRALQANRAQVLLQPHDLAEQSEHSGHNGHTRER